MSHTNHINAHNNHSNHTNSLAPICTSIGTTFTKLPGPKTHQTFWNDVKAKISAVRARFNLPNTAAKNTYTPPVNTDVLASQWNTSVKGRLDTTEVNSNGRTVNLSSWGINPPLATSDVSRLSVLGYDEAMNYAASKYCNTVCPSVCITVHTAHVQHNNHTLHNSHGQHGSHSDHSNHGAHSQHRDHTASHSSHDASGHSDSW